MNVLKKEPALISAGVAAVIALLLAFGLKLSNEQVGAIMGVVSIIMGVITRQQVSPTSTVVAQSVDGEVVASDASPLSNGTPVVVSGIEPTITPGGLYS